MRPKLKLALDHETKAPLDLIKLTKENYEEAIKAHKRSRAFGFTDLPEAGSVVKMWFENAIETLISMIVIKRSLRHHPQMPDYRLN